MRARHPLLRLAGAALAAGVLAAAVPSQGHAAPPPARDRATALLAAMTPAQRVGQLFMAGTPATDAAAGVELVTRYAVGNVMLTGRSTAGSRPTALVAHRLQAAVRRTAPGLFVATDQEGGAVQVLRGPGFSAMPSALAQGRLPTATLMARARSWGRQLQGAGVNLNLAPVVDTVPSPAAAASNAPIGHWERQYGYTPTSVAAAGVAVTRGMLAAGVGTAVKHFPGLGRVTANTDTARNVVDRVTTRTDAYLRPFAAAVKAGSPFVMVSSAYYRRIDPSRPAAFSSTVIDGMLRHDLGFHGVVISDDIGNAVQLSEWSPAERAVRFLAAGGDMVLTVNPSVVPEMVSAVLAKVKADSGFAKRVDAAALRVLRAKERMGLLPSAGGR
ncbi:glycoside hydrolase family 3 N-terminal domain-containing protein [Motilibacter aurantiacus]|uniref:glycoside hydrolase family 3 N-terminal domain-containing protein n=1 Tax=Motilibacter aurantiacus TaxID=2714955 RepID=UPI002F2B52A4